MKEIDYFIKSNTKLLEEAIEKRKNAKDEETINRLTLFIERYQYYIMGLEDAKRYIIKEKNHNKKEVK